MSFDIFVTRFFLNLEIWDRFTFVIDWIISRLVYASIMWSSNWVRTLFFNSTQLDEQDSKFSSRIRTFELVQSSSSNKVWSLKSIRRTELFVQFNSSNKILDSILELIVQLEIFVWVEIRIECSTNKYVCSIQFVERNVVFDSIRRTKTRIRSIFSNKTDELDSIRRTKNLCSILFNSRIERSSSSSIQLVDHSTHRESRSFRTNWWKFQVIEMSRRCINDRDNHD